MRHLIVLGALALAACGGVAGGNEAAGNSLGSAFEGGFRESYREKFVGSCSSGAKDAATKAGNVAAAKLDFGKICACAADKLLATKSVGELMTGPSEADQAAVTTQCLKENPLG